MHIRLFLFFCLVMGAEFCVLEHVFVQAAQAQPGGQTRVVYGFDREYPPFSYEDAGGKPVGFEVELMESIFKDGTSLTTRPMNWFSIPLELSSGTIQVSTGMMKTQQRERLYGFSTLPTFQVKIRFFTKTYKRVPNISYFRGLAVGVEKDSYPQVLLEQFGGVNIKPFATRQQALRALFNDEVDAYCGVDEPAYYVMRKLNFTGIVAVGTPLAKTPMYVAVSRERGDIFRMVNEGMQTLVQNGEYNRIYRKWFITELSENEQKSLVEAAKKATLSAYAPYGGKTLGAAVLSATGHVSTGSTLENADPALSVSALRNAVAASIGAGETELRAAVVVNEKGEIVDPDTLDCQTLYEFGRGILVLRSPDGKSLATPMVAELLPDPVTRPVVAGQPQGDSFLR